MNGFVVSVGKDSERSIRFGCLESRFGDGGSTRRRAVVLALRLLFDERARTFAAMMATAALFLCDSNQVASVVLLLLAAMEAGLCALFCFAQVDAFLLGMMRFLSLAAITLDVGRALLAFEATVLALCDRATLFGYEGQLAVWTAQQSATQIPDAGKFRWRRHTSVGAATNSVTFQA